MQGRPLVVGLDDQPFAFGRCVLQQLGIEQPTPADEVSCHAADVLCRLQPHARGWQLVRARPCDAGAVPLFHPHPPRPLPGPLGGLTGQDAPPQWLCPGATPTVALDQSNRNVGVAVCCLVERANMVLLTRRAAHLHAFPSVWVLPGGHVDAGESLAQAAARELREETGIECDTAQLVPFALFESMYPPEALAVPVRHHVVMFFRLQLGDGHVEVTCQQAEVDAWCWMDGTSLGRGFLDGEPCFDANHEFHYELVPSRRKSSSPMLALQGNPDANGRYGPDRMSTATKYVLKLRFAH